MQSQDTPQDAQPPTPPPQDAPAPDAAQRTARMLVALDMLDTLIDLDARIRGLEAAAGLT